MAVKTNFAKNEFVQILKNYNFGEFAYSMPISSGTVQTNFILYTTTKKLVFRYYENRSKGSVLF
jgi:homoserine kinase type II